MFKGESRLVVVATKALGLGIDLSDVRCQRSCGQHFCFFPYLKPCGSGAADGKADKLVMISHWLTRPTDSSKAAAQGHASKVLVQYSYISGVGTPNGSDRRYRLAHTLPYLTLRFFWISSSSTFGPAYRSDIGPSPSGQAHCRSPYRSQHRTWPWTD